MSFPKFIYKSGSISLGIMILAIFLVTPAFAKKAPIEIIMKNEGYHISSNGSSGGTAPGFSLTAGEQTEVLLKNEDHVAHDFVSKMFNKMNVTMVGEATSIKVRGASGYRVMPGKSVVIKFVPPVSEEFEGGWDVFWCSIHGKQNMRGEVVVVDTRVGSCAF